jgi:Methyltransferase domain
VAGHSGRGPDRIVCLRSNVTLSGVTARIEQPVSLPPEVFFEDDLRPENAPIGVDARPRYHAADRDRVPYQCRVGTVYYFKRLSASFTRANASEHARQKCITPKSAMPFSTLQQHVFQHHAYGQKSSYTSLDRYPAIFSAVRLYSEQNRATSQGKRKILSYGCSTGEECFSLRKYFPDDDIYGCDIDQQVLAIAKRRSVGDNITFFHSTPTEITRLGAFDIVFSLSSLCFYPEANVKYRRNPFSFSQFRTNVEILDANLKQNGILIVYNANYSFLELPISSRYHVILPNTVYENGFVNKHHKDSTPFTITLNRDGHNCHQMVSSPRNYTDIDFKHCIYQKTSGERYFREIIASPVQDANMELLSKYLFSDDDLFQGPDLLSMAIHLEFLRNQFGIYEKYDIKRISIEQTGKFITVGSFIRPAHL